MCTLGKKFSMSFLVVLLVLALSGCKDTAASADTETSLSDAETVLLDTETVLSDSDTEEILLDTEETFSDTEEALSDDTEETLSDIEDSSVAVPFRFVDALGEWHETSILPEVQKHPYNWTYLKNDSSGISYNDSHYTIRKGIDVSYHQGTIDWEKVKAEGYDFAIIRIGYRGYGSSGVVKLDTSFHENIKNAQKAGFDVGVYFFAQAINEQEAIEEAEFVLDALEGYELQLPVVYDPELIRDAVARTDNVSGEQFTKNTIVFCNMIKEAGFEPMIYSNMIWEAFLFDMTQLQEYPFWYADYETIPQTPYDFVMWQYSEKGRVNGIDGVVDLNVWFCPTNP